MVSLTSVFLALGAATAHAGPSDPAFCAQAGWGVPGLGSTPQDWWPVATVTATPDDPRWTGASGHSLTSGSATAPAELRMKWQDVGGQRYLYLSWQFFVAPTDYDVDHALYVAFKNATETRVVRLAFGGASTNTDVTYCDTPTPDGCDNGYTVFAGTTTNNLTCGQIDNPTAGIRLLKLGSADTAADIPWLKTTARFWRDPWTSSPTADRWTVQMRIPIVAATTDLRDGIAEGTEIAYQASLERTDSSFVFGRWPRGTGTTDTEQFCVRVGATSQSLVVRDTSVYRPLSLVGGGGAAPAGGCSGNVKLDMNKIGFVDPMNPEGTMSYQLNTASGTTTIGARVTNNSGASIAAHTMFARFRLANWGAQSPGSFLDVPVSGGGSTGTPSERDNANAINVGDGTITLTWDLTPDQKCQYTWQMNSSPGWVAECTLCDFPGGGANDGSMARVGGDGTCHEGKWLHQCVAVELRGGNVDFENRSQYNNLDFAPLSVDQHVAVVDTKGLAVKPGQKWHEIYFIVMPRNMPRSMPGQTMQQLVAEAAAITVKNETGWDPNNPDGPGFPVPTQPTHGDGEGGDTYGIPETERERWINLARVAQGAAAQVEGKQLAETAYSSFDSGTAAHLIPSLEVYVFYKVFGTGDQESAPTIAPLTSFTLATHHDGAFNGFAWTIDGATPIGGNVYRTMIPIEKFRRVQVKVEAIEGGAQTIKQDDNWPCAGGCAACGGGNRNCSEAYQMGNFGLAGLVLVWVTRRRRRSNKPATRL